MHDCIYCSIAPLPCLPSCPSFPPFLKSCLFEIDLFPSTPVGNALRVASYPLACHFLATMSVCMLLHFLLNNTQHSLYLLIPKLTHALFFLPHMFTTTSNTHSLSMLLTTVHRATCIKLVSIQILLNSHLTICHFLFFLFLTKSTN